MASEDGSSQSAAGESAALTIGPAHHGLARWRILPLLGPAFVAAIAYIDPGNYATNIQAGAKFGYGLLWVVVSSNLMAAFIQLLSSKLGIATGSSLATQIGLHVPSAVRILYWFQAEVVAIATDLAEFVGAALGFHLLLGMSLISGAVCTAVLSFVILALEHHGPKSLEVVVGGMLGAVVLIYIGELSLVHVDVKAAFLGAVIPQARGHDAWYSAAGILGATIMPHVIYLHSALSGIEVNRVRRQVQARMLTATYWDIGLAMSLAGFVNIAMIIMAAAVLHDRGSGDLGDIELAYRTLEPMLGSAAADIFGASLIISGVSSTVVGTLAGQEVMQDFVHVRISIWLRRVVTMTPAFVVILLGFNVTQVLVTSQVILSFGIAFALIPLLLLTSHRKSMGALVNTRLTQMVGWICLAVVLALNAMVVIPGF